MNIDASLRERLQAGLQRLTLLYGELADDGRDLLAQTEFSLDRVLQMLDHRDLVIQEVQAIELELVSALGAAGSEHAVAGLLQVVKTLESGSLPALEDAARFRTALAALVDVDELVAKRLREARSDLEAEIKRLRRSSRLVQGYRPANPTGSAFIDKIK
ncbi:MAG TPA: hypothetical protein PLU72_00215 [Candidatus Ozemobacteraceae bacterium]|nr:hypothetical protein [Candidatus Ozemobacteraceae bacterium]